MNIISTFLGQAVPRNALTLLTHHSEILGRAGGREARILRIKWGSLIRHFDADERSPTKVMPRRRIAWTKMHNVC